MAWYRAAVKCMEPQKRKRQNDQTSEKDETDPHRISAQHLVKREYLFRGKYVRSPHPWADNAETFSNGKNVWSEEGPFVINHSIWKATQNYGNRCMLCHFINCDNAIHKHISKFFQSTFRKIVYRSLRATERPCQGLKPPGSSRVPVAEAIERGSQFCSAYIHTTLFLDIAVEKYAWRNILESRIAVISLDRLPASVRVINGEKAALEDPVYGRDSKAWRFASSDEEIVLDGEIPQSAILDVLKFEPEKLTYEDDMDSIALTDSSIPKAWHLVSDETFVNARRRHYSFLSRALCFETHQQALNLEREVTLHALESNLLGEGAVTVEVKCDGRVIACINDASVYKDSAQAWLAMGVDRATITSASTKTTVNWSPLTIVEDPSTLKVCIAIALEEEHVETLQYYGYLLDDLWADAARVPAPC